MDRCIIVDIHTTLFFYLLLYAYLVHVSSRQIRYALTLWASALFFPHSDHFFISTFRGNFGVNLSIFFEKRPLFMICVFKDRFGIPLGHAILEHFVSRVNPQNMTEKKRITPLEKLLCLNHMYTRKKKEEKRKHEEGAETRNKMNIRKKEKQSKHALRAQAEPLGQG